MFSFWLLVCIVEPYVGPDLVEYASVTFMVSFSGRRYIRWMKNEEDELKKYFKSFYLGKETKKLPGQDKTICNLLMDML